MTANPAEFERVQALIQEANVQFINLQFSDIVGIVKQVSIPTHQWPQAVQDGIWFDGSSVEGFARIAESGDPGALLHNPESERLKSVLTRFHG